MRLPPFRLERFLARWEFAVDHVLCASDCETLSIRDLLDLEPDAEGQLLDLRLGYTESQGSPQLRREIAGLYETLDEDDVVVFSGAEEAIFAFSQAELEPGDRAVAETPCYQSLGEIGRSLDADILTWPCREEAAWAPDPKELVRLLARPTRAVLVNTPHNPTGHHFRAPELLELVEITTEHGARLFCDEVYRLLEVDPTRRLPAACDLDPRAVSLGVMSKSLGLAGLRIGWLASRDRELLHRVQVVKDYTTICASAPSEALALLALRHRQTLLDRNLRIVEHNLELLDAFFERWSERLSWVRPQAGSVALPRLLAETSAEAFCQRLVESTGVLLLPSTVFDHGDQHVRLGFGRRDFEEGLRRLEGWLEAEKA